MFDRKEAKAKAKHNLKKHYAIFVISCLLASFIGTSYASSTYLVKNNDSSIEFTESIDAKSSESPLVDLLFNGLDKAQESVNNSKPEDRKLGPIELGYTNGVLASVMSNFSSGSIFVVIYKAAKTLFSDKDIIAKVLVVFAAFLLAFVSFLVRGSFKIIYRRIFLEGYTYDKVKAPRYLYIFRIKKFFNVAWTSFVTELYSFLWSLTIVGGIIKLFSYSQVFYISAENPGIKANQAVTLSRKMMKGHKWELFKHYVTFLGWYILDGLTFGITGIVFSNAYFECFSVQYYAYVRQLAIDNKIDGYELLNDEYLFKKANKETLMAHYRDIYENRDVIPDFPKYGKVERFFARGLGVVLRYDEKSNQYNKALFEQTKHDIFESIFESEIYPERLSPFEIEEKAKKDTVILANRQYSITTLIAIFFILSFIGWLWEVSLHIVNDGTFVNRGILKGPWLPVYGSGILLILLFLYRFRKSVLQEFATSIVLCGFVEYFTSVFLELTHNGTRWWNYSGYFLNLNGRICAEGLLVFGLGGIAAVYFLAPLIDNLLRKVNQKALKIICTILVIIFALDVCYSHKHPNMGEGITSDASNVVYRNEEIC